jgi:arsenate reductase (glutaredoxin)
MTLTIYHNPRCSKSRETLKLIEEQGIEPQIVRYLETPPNAQTLDELLNLLRLEPRELIRRKEPEYEELGLDDPSLSRESLIAAMVAHPRLIERPIVVKDGKAILGRPPTRVLDLL